MTLGISMLGGESNLLEGPTTPTDMLLRPDKPDVLLGG